MKDDEVLRQIRLGDPLVAADSEETTGHDPAEILGRVLAHPRRPPVRARRPSFQTVLLVALCAAVLAAPAAVAFRRQLLHLIQQPTVVSALDGSYSATFTGLSPASLNGRWTLRFSPISDRGGVSGTYTRSHNGKIVASGGFGFGYQKLGPILILHDVAGPQQCANDIRVSDAYIVQFSGSAIILKPLLVDRCQRRGQILSAHRFSRG